MALNSEQTTLLELLAPGTYAFSEITPEQQQLLAITLRPIGPFTDEQRALLVDWYLLVTPEQIAAANATLAPLSLGIGSRQTSDDRTVTNADLLTDCMRPGDTYQAIAPFLSTLKIIRIAPEEFPV